MTFVRNVTCGGVLRLGLTFTKYTSFTSKIYKTINDEILAMHLLDRMESLFLFSLIIELLIPKIYF